MKRNKKGLRNVSGLGLSKTIFFLSGVKISKREKDEKRKEKNYN